MSSGELAFNITLEGDGCRSRGREVFLPYSTSGSDEVRLALGQQPGNVVR